MLSSRRLSIALFTALSLLLVLPALASADTQLEAEPTSASFGTVGINEPAGSQSIKIKNVGGEAAVLIGLSVPFPYGIDSGSSDCDDIPLIEPSFSCNLQVLFDPLSAGLAEGVINFGYMDLAGPHQLEVPVAGTGVAGTLEGGTVTFNTQPYFYGSQQQQVNIANVTPYTVIGGNATITGPDAGLFGISYSNCNGSNINAFQNCQVGVNFNPTEAGTFEAQLEVENDGTVSPVVVPLSVEALEGPKAQISPDGIDFGPVEVGTSAPNQKLTVTNTGDFPLQVQQLLVISGTPAAFPLSEDGCTMQILNPAEECEVTVGFSPSRTGERFASIFMISNTPSPVNAVTINGEGLNVPDGTVSTTSQAKVGVPIFCIDRGFPDTDTVSYEWLRDSDPIAGATDSVYVPVAADVGHTLSCRVTAENPVGEQTITSDPSAAVAAADPGPQGPVGPEGPSGPAGQQGPGGPQGPTGPTGPAGPDGPGGSQGSTGDTGPQGSAGETGAQGPAGQNGAQGAAGQNGAKGDKGKTGARGPKGKQGKKGKRGKNGKVGKPRSMAIAASVATAPTAESPS